jgi:hypothetical protein
MIYAKHNHYYNNHPSPKQNRKYWRQQNIGADKIYASAILLASTKLLALTKIYASTKLLVSTKTRHRQKLGVDKMLVQTERWRRHRRISLLLTSAESAAADFSQALLKVSYFSLMMVLLSVHAVVK